MGPPGPATGFPLPLHFTQIQALGQLGYNNVTYSAKYVLRTAMLLGLKQDIHLYAFF
jgi:hypothetical protein